MFDAETSPASPARGRLSPAEIQRFEKAEASFAAAPGNPLEVVNRRRRIDQARERGGIRRHDEILFESTLQTQTWNAERFVLIRAPSIDESIG